MLLAGADERPTGPASPMRMKKRNQKMPPAIPRKDRSEVTSLIITSLKIDNKTTLSGTWDLLQEDQLNEAALAIGITSTNPKDDLFTILHKSGDVKHIRDLWKQYFEDENPVFKSIAKTDAMNDLVDYIVVEE